MASYTLMNKNTPVLDFEYDLEAHLATRITAVHDAATAPLGLFDERGQVSTGGAIGPSSPRASR